MSKFNLDILQMALPHIQVKGLAIDGGAHIGAWTQALLNEGFDSIYAFEPTSETFISLSEIMKHKSSVRLYNAALGNACELINVVNIEKKLGKSESHYIRFVDHILMEKEIIVDLNISMLTIDSLDLERLDFLKLDVEGFEYFILRGGKRTIKKYHPVIIIEQSSYPSKRYGISNGKASALLRYWGASSIANMGRDEIFAFKDSI